MGAPATTEDFVDLVRRSEQVEEARLEAFLSARCGAALPREPRQLAALMVREGLLTNFQAEQLLQGKYRGFVLGGYRILERIGSGGTGAVYLAEHQVMRRRVALKVLPPEYAEAPGVLERFRREAQAVAALDHANIVRAYDFRQEGGLHFFVMEYVEGVSLQELLLRQGALPVGQAADYARQAALGLQHAHEAGLVHRDVKPANLLVDRQGTVKLLDLGLARYAPEGQESLTKQFDEHAVMGTADYLAPEQALNLHAVDIRADVYSLGATLYALLAGEPPFHAGTVTQKLLWHQMREPRPLRSLRPDVPEGLEQVVGRMMAKGPGERYSTPAEVADALLPWAQGPYPAEVPDLPPAASGSGIITPRSLRSSERTGPQAPSPRSTQVAALPRLERAPEPDVPPVLAERRPLAKRSAGLWLALFVASAVLVVVIATASVGYFLWRAAQSARARVEEPNKPAEQEVVPPAPRARVFELPEGDGELFKLEGHTAPVRSVAISTSGALALSGSEDRTLRLWDLEKRQVRKIIAGHGDQVTSVHFARDGQLALSTSFDRSIRIWELPSGRERSRFTGHGGIVWGAVYSHDERQVLSCRADKALRLWDCTTLRTVRTFSGHNREVLCLAFAPAPRRLALSGGQDNVMRLWDVNNPKQVREFLGHTQPVTSVAFNPDSGRALSASRDGTIRMWDVNSGKELHLFRGHKGPVWSVAWSFDGKLGLSGGEDKTIRLWDLALGRQVWSYTGHAAGVTSVAFTLTSRHGISGSKDRSVRLWDLRR